MNGYSTSGNSPQPPDDVVSGIDPGVKYEVVVSQLYRCTCGARTMERADMISHQLFGHPAHRNPALTCHAAPMWDHERWCLRPAGHDGDHWTPSMNGGQSWPQFYRCPVGSKGRQCMKRKGHEARHAYGPATDASDAGAA